MARIRTVKPDFFTSLTIADLTHQARLTFIGVWTHVDDEGRCVDDARLVKAAVWPLDDRSATDVDVDLWELADAGLILRYTVGGKHYLAVRSWSEHQTINRSTASKHPAPQEGETTPKPHGALIEPSMRAHGFLTEDSCASSKGPPEGSHDPQIAPEMPDSGEGGEPGEHDDTDAAVVRLFTSEDNTPDPTNEGLTEDSLRTHCRKGREQGRERNIYSSSSPHGEADTEPSSPDPGSDDDPQWVTFWDRYPRKVSKKKARAAFTRALKKTAFDHLMAGLEHYLTHDRRALDGYVKDPVTWLNGECWNDEPPLPAAAGNPTPNIRPKNEWWYRQ